MDRFFPRRMQRDMFRLRGTHRIPRLEFDDRIPLPTLGGGPHRAPGPMNIAPLLRRINKLPKWARDYIHELETFTGVPQVHREVTFLRDQNKHLVKLVAQLKAENRHLKKWLGA